MMVYSLVEVAYNVEKTGEHFILENQDVFC